MTRRFFAISLPAVVARRKLRAETNESRGHKLVDKLVEGLGGDVFLNMHDRTEVGEAYSFAVRQISGKSIVHIYTQYREQSGPSDFPALREREAFLKNQDDAIIFAEGTAYEVNFRGARPVADDTLHRFIETTNRNVFYVIRQRLHEKGMYFESPGGDLVDNQAVEVLNITDPQNRKVTAYLHHLTSLPVMQKTRIMDPVLKEQREETTRFSNYRRVAPGIMWPWAIFRERDGEKVFQMFSSNVTVNNDLPDKLFRLPPGVKMLKKES